MNLKFFYVIDYNLKNPLLENLEISKTFNGFKQATVNSKAFTDDVECIQSAVDVLQKKHIEIVTLNSFQNVKLDFLELYNPEFAPDGEEDGDLDEEDLAIFEENSIVVYMLNDAKTNDWLIKASVLIYENTAARSLH